jgi:hypothetical protein
MISMKNKSLKSLWATDPRYNLTMVIVLMVCMAIIGVGQSVAGISLLSSVAFLSMFVALVGNTYLFVDNLLAEISRKINCKQANIDAALHAQPTKTTIGEGEEALFKVVPLE